ncbi:FGGY-family carbohydrate kinase [Murimonas intestini]|uniref:ATP:glycerol 3-phosphotransferase n=1 Tax=Murimonas intestini TaxID=1337051 RepID=A0AB73T419_9FIRM|nr:glycerol kinase [Murimonas intestini]MCR1840893.1 glycerol kinase GlpK [Murimonas intestini]MCR1865988.1 glycerol kinase GlpK [Murimonas intestini]MCR1883408.1 glycerol kinase GlpK [Murimonas intestini]
MAGYILGIDQSTQGTKAMIFDGAGKMLGRFDLPHRQIVNEKGWVSHDPEEIFANTVKVVEGVIGKTGIDKNLIKGAGISNQRETALVWDKQTGRPLAPAIVWQCSRAAELCSRLEENGSGQMSGEECRAAVKNTTGIPMSPYFPAAKWSWILENTPGAKEKAAAGELCFGTIDTWLVYCLTGGKSYKTDYSNASRTQAFDIVNLCWSPEVCGIFGIDPKALAEVCDSDSCFGMSDFNGVLDREIPIHGVMGDSHGALFGQGCLKKGMIKTTYGTGSSIMMNIGEEPVFSTHGVVTSLAWSRNGKAEYVLEGNINYTGAVITWLKDDMKLVSSPSETEELAGLANKEDTAYLVPAFTGLGAPYWNSKAKASIVGITRTTGRAEVVKAGLECIAYQITDIVKAMGEDAKLAIGELRVDGGPTRNAYLMQFQSDMLGIPVQVPDAEELSGIGASYMAGLALGMYDEKVFETIGRSRFEPSMDEKVKDKKYAGWLDAVHSVLR